MDKTPSETSPKVATKRSSEPTKDEPATKKPGLKFSKLPPLPKPRKFVLTPQKTKKEISIKLTSKEEKESANIKVVPKSAKAAAVFNEDSDSEPEEMPVEARMRMKNIGRDTPTSAGPNSFNKGKLGFVDSHKQWELQQLDILKKIKK